MVLGFAKERLNPTYRLFQELDLRVYHEGHGMVVGGGNEPNPFSLIYNFPTNIQKTSYWSEKVLDIFKNTVKISTNMVTKSFTFTPLFKRPSLTFTPRESGPLALR
jgi:hypothetical protein